MSETNFRISEAVTPEERDAAFALRYQVFVDELGYRIPGAEATRRIVDPEDEHAFLMLGRAGDAVAATAAVDWWGRTELAPAKVANYQLQPFADAFGRESVCIF